METVDEQGPGLKENIKEGEKDESPEDFYSQVSMCDGGLVTMNEELGGGPFVSSVLISSPNQSASTSRIPCWYGEPVERRMDRCLESILCSILFLSLSCGGGET